MEGDTAVTEPLIHSGITDTLPQDHPLAYEPVYCDSCSRCATMLHASNNENMQTWVEISGTSKWRGNYCLPCFVRIDQDGDWTDA